MIFKIIKIQSFEYIIIFGIHRNFYLKLLEVK